MDYSLLRRYITFFQDILPISMSSKFIETFYLNNKFNHDLYNLRPQYHVLCKDPSINDALPSKLISKSVLLKKDIKYFTENGVVFEGENSVTEIDTVIMATGYEWKFPFLGDDIITTENDGRINLYKCMWSPNLKHQTLVVIGFVLPFGPGFPLGEIQCRWVAQIFSGKMKLPSKDVMMDEIVKRHEVNMKRYRPGDKMSIRVDYIPYMDDIASQFGAKPNLLKILITDPKLFKALVLGPSLSYQYRLQGPHKWDGARKAILDANERVKAPLNGTDSKRKKNLRWSFLVKYVINLLLLSLWISWKDSSMKYYIAAMLLPQYMSLKSFFLKYVIATLMLPFLFSWNEFMPNFIFTHLASLILAAMSSL
ncbi:Dimethylaniline monooxygenase [N-oxide-forming] 5, partial [Stegodyphus mimosarum]